MVRATHAKRYRIALFCALFLAPACAGIERFAPPGIVKYEDLAGDTPQNEAIKTRITEVSAQGEATFPNLSAAPQGAPETMTPEEQAEFEVELVAAREALNAAVVADRAAVAAAPVVLPGVVESPTELSAVRDALKAAVQNDDAAARKGRGLPARKTTE
jgi:hypothetical protein